MFFLNAIILNIGGFDNEKENRNKLKAVIKFAVRSLCLKKVRTLFTIIAISLGVISMALVTNLANSFTKEINELEESAVAVFPITISSGDYEITDEKGCVIVPLYHPNYLILKPSAKRDVWNALQNIEKLLKNA